MTSTSPVNISPDLLPELRNDPRLLSMIEQDEGFSGQLYKDSEGLDTIGIGFCLDRRPMPREVAIFWLDLILDELTEAIGKTQHYDTYVTLNRERKFAILNMCYQMGVVGVCHPVSGFIDMWGSLKVGDYDRAAHHAIDSAWYHQTPNRAMRVATVIRTGSLSQYGM